MARSLPGVLAFHRCQRGMLVALGDPAPSLQPLRRRPKSRSADRPPRELRAPSPAPLNDILGPQQRMEAEVFRRGPCRVQLPAGEWPDINGGLTYTDRVQGACGATLLQLYASKHSQSGSEEEWRQCIVEGRISVNGAAVLDPHTPVPPNAVLEMRRPGWAEPAAPAFLDVLWWDPHIVAVHKPSGLQVLPAGPVHERCALTLLRQFHAEHASELEGMPAPVHRIGRGTSGVLICACSPVARRLLSKDFVEHGSAGDGKLAGAGGSQAAAQGGLAAAGAAAGAEPGTAAATGGASLAAAPAAAGGERPRRPLRKVYRTLVSGLVQADEGVIDVAIGRMPYPGVRGGLHAACPPGSPGAKPSRSRYCVLRRDVGAGTTLVDVEIFTGRPHQIRIHMAALGHPLLGDPLYGPGGVPRPAEGAAEEARGGGACEGSREGSDSAACAPEPAAAESLPAEPDAAAAANAGSQTSGGGGLPARPRPAVALPGDCGYLLHSRVLEFDHPITGERVVATCLPPPPLRLPEEQHAEEARRAETAGAVDRAAPSVAAAAAVPA